MNGERCRTAMRISSEDLETLSELERQYRRDVGIGER